MLNNPFFTGFLKVSNWYTIGAIVLLVLALFILKKLKDKKMAFSKRMMIALIFGLAIGVGVDLVGQHFGGDTYALVANKEINMWFAILGTGFLKLVQLLAVPIVFLSIVEVMASVQGKNLGKLTVKTFAMLLGTTAISAIVAILLVNLFDLSSFGFTGTLSDQMLDKTTAVAQQSFPEFFLNLIPKNIFAAFSDNSAIVSVVIIAAMFAAALRFLNVKKPEQVKPFTDFLTSAKLVVTSVLTNVIKYMPFGIVALVANTIIGNGIESIKGMAGFIGVLYLAVFVMLLVYVVILLFVGVNPVQFYKKAFSTLVFAFTSRSSVGTLPYTLETLEQGMGVSKETSNFVATLGTTIGMNGCAGVFPAMLGVLVAAANGGTLNISFYVMLVLVVTIGSIGIAGVPGTAAVAATVTLNGIGYGSAMQSIGGIFGIDPIVDMGRTMLNVAGSMVSSIVVDRTSGTMDMQTFNETIVKEDA